MTAGLLLGGTLVLGGTGVGITYMVMARSLDLSIADAAADLSALQRSRGRAAVIAAISQRERVATNTIDFALFDAAGRPLAGRGDVGPPSTGWHDMLFPDPVEGGDPTRVLMMRLQNGDRLMAAGNRRPLLIARAAIGWLFLASMIFVTLLCAVAGWLLQRYLGRRVRPIVETADAVVRGEFGHRIPDRGTGDEFDQIALSLNLMLERIAGLIANLRQVTSDLAHDLRTPLTRIRAGLERAAPLSSDRAADAVQQAIVQIDDVVLMFDAILRIAEIDGTAHRDTTPIDLTALVRDIVGAMLPAFTAEGIELVCETDAGCIIRGDRMQVAAAIINLLENILRHGADGPVAQVIVARAANRTLLTVRDTGPGVPDADLARIFDRFVRLDRSRSTAGHGLGLSIVKAVATSHEADLAARNVDGGLAVTLAFPSAGGAV